MNSKNCCNHCKVEKPFDEFGINKNICKKCTSANKKARSEKREENLVNKTCKHCKETKDKAEFESGRFVCRLCKRTRNNNLVAEKEELIIIKKCKICKIEKNKSEFEAGRLECKICNNEKRRAAQKSAKFNKNPRVDNKPKYCKECNRSNLEVDFSWRTDTICGSWKSICKECFNKKGYDKKYRTKKINENLEAYRDHNSEVHRLWLNANNHKIQEQTEKRKTNVNTKISHIISHCKTTNKYFEFDDMDKLKEKLTRSCYYCDYKSEILNGLDRIDPSGDYTDKNTVSACATCNKMRYNYNISEFIKQVRDIVQFNKDYNFDLSIERKRLPPFSGSKELRCIEKNKVLNLTPCEVCDLQNMKCYLCGKEGGGIDRIDSTKDYDVDNTMPCCPMCNYMKCHLVLDDFKKHVFYIHNHTKYWDIDNIVIEKVKNENVRKPIAFYDGNVLIGVFGTIAKAAKKFDVSSPTIFKAIKNSDKSCGYTWKYISKEEYNSYDVQENENNIYKSTKNIIHKKNTQPIASIDESGNKTPYSSISDAANKLDVSNTSISIAIKNNTKSCKLNWVKISHEEYKQLQI